MTERTRTFTGTLPYSPLEEAWQAAHDALCERFRTCGHENPYSKTMPVLVHLFEDVEEVAPPEGEANMQPGHEEVTIVKMEVALGSGEGRTRRWSPPATMTEET